MLPCSNFKSFMILGETSADLIVEQFHASKAVKVGYHLILLRGACIKIGEDPVLWNAFLKFASMPLSGVRSIMVMNPAHPHLRSGTPTEEAIPLLRRSVIALTKIFGVVKDSCVEVEFEYYHLTEDVGEALGQQITKLSGLKKLSYNHLSCNEESMSAFLRMAVGRLPNLRYLVLQHQVFFNSDALYALVVGCKRLVAIDLSRCFMSPSAYERMLDAIENSQAMQVLCISNVYQTQAMLGLICRRMESGALPLLDIEFGNKEVGRTFKNSLNKYFRANLEKRKTTGMMLPMHIGDYKPNEIPLAFAALSTTSTGYQDIYTSLKHNFCHVLTEIGDVVSDDVVH
jgi:hypothetical protein